MARQKAARKGKGKSKAKRSTKKTSSSKKQHRDKYRQFKCSSNTGTLRGPSVPFELVNDNRFYPQQKPGYDMYGRPFTKRPTHSQINNALRMRR